MTKTRWLRLAHQLLGAEGARAVLDRWRDRHLDRQRRASFPDAGTERLRQILARPAPVINLLAQPPHRRLGGLAHQFLARYSAETQRRSCVVVYREAGGYRMEVESDRGERASRLWPAWFPSVLAGSDVDPSARDRVFEYTLAAIAEFAGAGGLHCEGVTGLPFASLSALARKGMRVVLSLHDFGLFCARPHLLEEPAGRFCEYSRDGERCARCLGSPGPPQHGLQERRRAAAAELLAHTAAVVCPSQFLCDAHRGLFGIAMPPGVVIAPQGLASALPPPARRANGQPQRVALVGSVQRHKGSAIFEEVVRATAAATNPPDWHVFGGGDRDTLHRLRALPGVHVHGYYRAGSLPARLRAARIDRALLLSIVPEAHGLTLEECTLAGVPVVAFDHGALGERIRTSGGGVLVPVEAGVAGVLAALASAPGTATPALPVAPTAPAEATLRLYAELGL
jgi:glycosyltransferase involved in cell wall biosynthesis